MTDYNIYMLSVAYYFSIVHCVGGSKHRYYSKGIGNTSNFYGRAVYYPNYGTRPPHNGRAVRAAVTQLDATALSSLPLLQIDSLQIVWYSNEEHGQCL